MPEATARRKGLLRFFTAARTARFVLLKKQEKVSREKVPA
jgi:hypothetical protein